MLTAGGRIRGLNKDKKKEDGKIAPGLKCKATHYASGQELLGVVGEKTEGGGWAVVWEGREAEGAQETQVATCYALSGTGVRYGGMHCPVLV